MANAAADGAGLHDAIYGQLDPRTGQVVKTGLFDTLFDDFVKQAPAELRPGLASRKPALREAGSIRMALQQNQRRRDYEQAEVDTALKTGAIAIGNADPDDHLAFEAARQEGLDLIDKMGVDPGIRQQMAKEWYGAAAKARLEALIARDPQRALDMLTTGATTEAASNDAAGDETMGWMFAPSSLKAAKGDDVGKLTPDERVAQAFGDDVLTPDRTMTMAAQEYITALPANEIERLIDQAHTATAAQLIQARANIALALQNAPEAIASSGNYFGFIPTLSDFAATYGAEEGSKQYYRFSQKIDIGRQAFRMRTMTNQAIHAAMRDAEPGPGSSGEKQRRYQVTAAAALKTFSMRREDPAGYVQQVIPSVNAAWRDLSEGSDPTAYQDAIARSVAAQRQIGVIDVRPLPQIVAVSIANMLTDVGVSQQQKSSTLRRFLTATSDPDVAAATSSQISAALQQSKARSNERAYSDASSQRSNDQEPPDLAAGQKAYAGGHREGSFPRNHNNPEVEPLPLEDTSSETEIVGENADADAARRRAFHQARRARMNARAATAAAIFRAFLRFAGRGVTKIAGPVAGLLISDPAGSPEEKDEERFLERVNQEIMPRIPRGWTVKQNGQGFGFTFSDPTRKQVSIRVDKGDPNSDFPSQQIDHVVVNNGRGVVGVDGNLTGISIDPLNAHVSMDVYKGWKDILKP
ncbi:hypothetical protein [Mesorhizobium comanense]|uniref:hypothetical protein n=1 Tax=Mesorhizobium comanense TaxID=2502215 RepID=UPI0010F789E0|nr:hypothetical protein [Mesorhizobium comanense]